MGYELHDENGELGSGPSITGLRELKEFFYKQDVSSYPALDMLLTHGITHLTVPLSKECKILAKKAKVKGVIETLMSMSKDAAKAKGCVILTSGTS